MWKLGGIAGSRLTDARFGGGVGLAEAAGGSGLEDGGIGLLGDGCAVGGIGLADEKALAARTAEMAPAKPWAGGAITSRGPEAASPGGIVGGGAYDGANDAEASEAPAVDNRAACALVRSEGCCGGNIGAGCAIDARDDAPLSRGGFGMLLPGRSEKLGARALSGWSRMGARFTGTTAIGAGAATAGRVSGGSGDVLGLLVPLLSAVRMSRDGVRTLERLWRSAPAATSATADERRRLPALTPAERRTLLPGGGTPSPADDGMSRLSRRPLQRCWRSSAAAEIFLLEPPREAGCTCGAGDDGPPPTFDAVDARHPGEASSIPPACDEDIRGVDWRCAAICDAASDSCCSMMSFCSSAYRLRTSASSAATRAWRNESAALSCSARSRATSSRARSTSS